MKEKIRNILLDSGAVKVGFAQAGEIDSEVNESYSRWVEKGYNGEMGYLQRHIPLRKHTDNVLPEASSVISLAFSYSQTDWRSSRLPLIAAYAYDEDYHIVLREILQPVVKSLQKEFGGKWRICIDSAPVAERYWAMKSGIGKRGLNGSIIVDGCGSFCFLVEILTTLKIEPDISSCENCDGCGNCVRICPGNALLGDGTIDATRCVNYLTIEKRDDFTFEEIEILKKDKGFIFGCDRCLRVCPHNKHISPTSIKNFLLKDDIKYLSHEKLISLDELQFKKQFSRSPLSYAGLSRLKRNINSFLSNSGK